MKDGKLYIAKSRDVNLEIGYGRRGKERILPSEPSSATITKTSTGKYYISFVCEYIPNKTNGNGEIGIDLGIKDFIVTSNGDKITNPKYYKLHERNLKRKQQVLSRSKKGSNNRNKARLKVASIHEKLSNLRNNFQHQLSRKLINENQVIGIENLMVKNMVKNRKLSKSISQVAWSSFINKLLYKAIESQHCNIVRMDTFYPSTHICNSTQKKLDFKLNLKDRDFKCPHCNLVHDRDTNAAMNIRDEAVRQLALHAPDISGMILLAKIAA